MPNNDWKDKQGYDKINHKTTALFTEWPTQAEVVKGFEGNPNKVERKQWKPKDTPDAE